MTDHQPEGTRLAAQLGDAVGGPETPAPDPETEIVDLRRKVGEATRLGESWSMEDGIRREDGLSLLAVLGDAGVPVGAVLDRTEEAEIDSAVPPTRSPSGVPENAQALTTAALLGQLREKVSAAVGPAWGPAAVARALEAVTPFAEHATEAAAGSHEGIRLWMLDCGELVAKHRERAVAAEGKLAAIAALDPWETCASTGADLVRVSDILAITGTEGNEGQ